MEWYGKAYRLDPDVEKHVDYSKTEAQSNQRKQQREKGKVEEKVPFDIDCCHAVEIQEQLNSEPSEQPLGLPDDLLLRIMREAGRIYAPNVDTIARTCRKMYLVSRSEDLWRHLASLSDARPKADVILPSLSGYLSYRHMFLLRPRIRTDGIYINKITYFRPGFSESSMTNPVHLVTYYRYLRFFGDAEGYTVWWLTSTVPPARVLDSLRNPPRSTSFDAVATGETANVFHGHWRRSTESDSCFELSLHDPKKSRGTRTMQWRMKLEMQQSRSKASVKHNVMKCLQYEAISESEPPLVIDIGDWSKFYFSKVRSYLT